MFHHQMKHLKVRQKYSTARRIFYSLLGVSSGDEALCLILDMLRENLSIQIRINLDLQTDHNKTLVTRANE